MWNGRGEEQREEEQEGGGEKKGKEERQSNVASLIPLRNGFDLTTYPPFLPTQQQLPKAKPKEAGTRLPPR